MKIFEQLVAIVVMVLVTCSFLTSCTPRVENKVIIYSSAEEYRLEDLRARLKEEFPDYTVDVEYLATGTHAAKLIAEGKNTECDITYDLDYAYLEKLAEMGYLADVSEYDLSVYAEDAVRGNYFVPELRNGGAVIVNPEVLAENGLPVPESYEDLLKPEYKKLISMPSPKSSGTGYIFLKALVNEWGETEAFAYFDKLNENILSYTTSGSGPVNALIQKEAAIGLGMTAQAVTAINDGANLEIHYFAEGSPYSLYGQAMISGKEKKESVKKVFDFMVKEYGRETNKKFYPEKIFKDGAAEIQNYPKDIQYSDMGGDSNEEKTRLLDKWKY